jgi:hypothetical protein
MKAKSILKSKTFWLQIIDSVTIILPLVGGTVIGQPALGLVLNGLTIGARLITKGPVYVINDAAKEP